MSCPPHLSRNTGAGMCRYKKLLDERVLFKDLTSPNPESMFSVKNCHLIIERAFKANAPSQPAFLPVHFSRISA